MRLLKVPGEHATYWPYANDQFAKIPCMDERLNDWMEFLDVCWFMSLGSESNHAQLRGEIKKKQKVRWILLKWAHISRFQNYIHDTNRWTSQIKTERDAVFLAIEKQEKMQEVQQGSDPWLSKRKLQ